MKKKNNEVMDMHEHDVKQVYSLVDYLNQYTLTRAKIVDVESRLMVELDRKYNQATAEQAWDYIRACTEPHFWKEA